MLLHLGNLFLCALILLNLLGLTLAVGFWLRNAWIAIASGPLILCTILFPIECFHGLGQLAWVFPITTALSVFLISEVERKESMLSRLEGYLPVAGWKEALSLAKNPTPYILFLLLFTYSLSWRYFKPEIGSSTELIADLSHVCAYQTGQTIPVDDYWYPFLKSTHYYPLQYYAAGLMGRIFQLEPGVTYNLSFVTCCAYAFYVSVAVIWNLSSYNLVRIPVALHFLFGGTGVTLFLYIFKKPPYLWDYQRFIGNGDTDNNTSYGTALAAYDKSWTQDELPGESLGYSTWLGDYHPVLSGFYVLGFALLVAVMWTKLRIPSLLYLLGASIPWVILADTWNLPILAIPMGAFLSYHFGVLISDGSWKNVPLGCCIVLACFFPYLFLMFSGSIDIPVSMRWVGDQHAPPFTYILYFLPTLGLILFSFLSRKSDLAVLATLWAGMLFFTEFFFIKDIYPGEYDRFNTTLKWWPCVSQLTLVTLAPLYFQRKYRGEAKFTFSNILVASLVIYPIAFGYELYWEMYANWIYRTHGWGRLDGSYLVTGNIDGNDAKDGACYLEGEKWVGYKYDFAHPFDMKWDPDADMCFYYICNYSDWELALLRQPGTKIYCNNRRFLLENLKALPRNLVFVEHPELDSGKVDNDFTQDTLMTLLSNHRSFVGWVGHEELWRGTPPAVRYRYDNLKKLYAGTLPGAGDWFSSQGVDIILWFKKEDTKEMWTKVDASLAGHYRWFDFITEGDGNKIGYWYRVPNSWMDPSAPSLSPASNGTEAAVVTPSSAPATGTPSPSASK